MKKWDAPKQAIQDQRVDLEAKIKHTAVLLAELHADINMLQGEARSNFLDKELAIVKSDIQHMQLTQLKSYFEHIQWKYQRKSEKLQPASPEMPPNAKTKSMLW